MSDRAGDVKPRVPSLDIVRGVVMVLMAIDHVRVYSGLPAGGPTPGIFFTRWITHFVAPAFLFFAGTSAYLYGERAGETKKLATFLLTRGLWLVFLELTVIRMAWTFNFDFGSYMLAGVIWMIGWCMVIMAALVFLPIRAIAAFGIVTIVAHNAVMPRLTEGSESVLWTFLYTGGGLGPLAVLFVIVPWIGVMAAGYAFGPVMRMPSERRRTLCYQLGVGMIVAFLALRTLDFYGDPRHWRDAKGLLWLAFLNTTKYPASLLFLLMTLGPMLVLLGLVERGRGKLAEILETFGRVPFFYYLLHIPVIHLLAIAVSLLREGRVNPWLFGNFPLRPAEQPPGYAWSLWLLYVVWLIAIAILYPLCKRYARKRSDGGIYRYL